MNKLQTVGTVVGIAVGIVILSNTLGPSLFARSPGQVYDLTIEQFEDNVRIKWQPPLGSDGSSIRDYIVQYKRQSDNSFVIYNDGVGPATEAVIRDLDRGSSYNFKVIAVNNAGNGPDSNIVSIAIPLAPQPPVAKINVARTGVVNQSIKFSADDSVDSDGAIARYMWDFGDGNLADTSTYFHTYDLPKGYLVTLKVIDNDGLSDTEEQIIRINSAIGSQTIQTSNLRTVDEFGNPLPQLHVNKHAIFTSSITNIGSSDQEFAYVIQVDDKFGKTITLAWITGSIAAGQSTESGLSWIPETTGKYTVKAYFWESVDNPVKISNDQTIEIEVI